MEGRGKKRKQGGAAAPPAMPVAERFFVCVSVGAGDYGVKNEDALRSVMAHACHGAAAALRRGEPAISGVQEAIAILENSPLTNAGLGSNLTLDGGVECDACIVGDDERFGAVGAASGITNPIRTAASLLTSARDDRHSNGLTPPVYLCGPGARRWAKAQGLPVAEESELLPAGQVASAPTFQVTPARYKAWQRNLSILQTIQQMPAPQTKRRRSDSGSRVHPPKGATGEAKEQDTAAAPHATTAAHDATHTVVNDDTEGAGERSNRLTSHGCSDTVGAVCVDMHGRVAAGASSGGQAVKHPGRTGPAAVPGCCCWVGTCSCVDCRGGCCCCCC